MNYQSQQTTVESYCNEKEPPPPRTSSKMYVLLIDPSDDFLIPGLNKWERELNNNLYTSPASEHYPSLVALIYLYANSGI